MPRMVSIAVRFSFSPSPPGDSSVSFFFNDTATTEIYTLSLHDALPISYARELSHDPSTPGSTDGSVFSSGARSEEHTSELQSQSNLVCRLLLEKKNPVRPRRSVLEPTSYQLSTHTIAASCSASTSGVAA